MLHSIISSLKPHLYNCSTKSETIPVAKFVEFMNDKQRDPRLNEILYPSYTDKRCMEIISLYEKNEEHVKASEKHSKRFRNG